MCSRMLNIAIIKCEVEHRVKMKNITQIGRDKYNINRWKLKHCVCGGQRIFIFKMFRNIRGQRNNQPWMVLICNKLLGTEIEKLTE